MKALSRALSYLKPHWLLATGTFVSLVLAAALNLAIPALTQQVIDNGIARGAVNTILWGAVAMVAVALFRALFSFTQAYWAAKAS
ncbi:MAG TPA: ABC transporter ATP-binding protein, partial [Anaerolineae bacterium]|nr:ABC transporter ATP-binding protein [Anaerolineae bacterium]